MKLFITVPDFLKKTCSQYGEDTTKLGFLNLLKNLVAVFSRVWPIMKF